MAGAARGEAVAREVGAAEPVVRPLVQMAAAARARAAAARARAVAARAAAAGAAAVGVVPGKLRLCLGQRRRQ